MKKGFLLSLLLITASSFLCLSAQVTITGADVATTTHTSLYSAFNAINGRVQTGRTIKIQISGNTTETTSAVLQDKGWSQLSIEPSGAGNYTLTFNPSNTNYNNPFIDLVNIQSNVEINGTNGSGGQLTFAGKYFVDNTGTNGAATNTTIYLRNGSSNITVRNCVFTGQDASRPVHTITGNGTNVTIEGNTFKNCLNLENSDRLIAVVDGYNNVTSGTGGYWKINDNQFYEETSAASPLLFKAAVSRAFMNLKTDKNGYNFEVSENYLGGNQPNCAGTLRIGNTTDSGSEYSTDFFLIYLNQSASVQYTSQSVIKNNTIGNIEAYNYTTSIKRFPQGTLGQIETNVPAVLYGIYAGNGNTLVDNNTIRNITWSTTLGLKTQNQHTMGGISGSNDDSMYNSFFSFTCNNNNISNLRLKTNVPGDVSPIMHYMISVIAYGGEATISNNKVLFGYNNPVEKIQSGDIFAIGLNLSGGYGSYCRGNIFNNICAVEEFNIGKQITHNVNLIKLVNNYYGFTPEPVINCYNNICYVQPKTPFTIGSVNIGYNVLTQLNGIGVILTNNAGSNTTNVFHNTVYINDIQNTATPVIESTSALFIAYNNAPKGALDIWNNIFVNKSNQGLGISAQSYGSNITTPTNIDYNTYYIPGNNSNFALAQLPLWTVLSTFDDWKFKNNSTLFNRTTGHDHHSRYLDPLFDNSTANVNINLSSTDVFTELGLLRTKLKPYEFLGGRKTETSVLASVGISSDNDNIDFGTTPAMRRPALPTMGAINTGFSDYWLGSSSSDWDTAGNWGAGIPPSDGNVIYAETVNHPLQVPVSGKSIRDYYNDTNVNFDLNGNALTVKGYIGQEGSSKIDATDEGSTIIYNGNTPSLSSGLAQHIFTGTFVNDKIYNFTLNNYSEYFVLLHDKLNIVNDFKMLNPASAGPHKGALNCIWYNTELKFSGTQADGNNIPQYIPQHSIYTDSVYDLVINSSKLITEHDDLYVKNNLTIGEGEIFGQSDKKFEISAGKLVKVSGLTTNNGGTGGLVIKSRQSESETTNNASFIFNNGKTNEYGNAIAATDVHATVEMFSPAKNLGSNNYRWQFFTVPVESAYTIQSLTNLWDTWIRRWDPVPTNGDPYYGTPYWLYIEMNDRITHEAGYTFQNVKGGMSQSYNMQGYEITMENPRVVPMQGKLTNKDFSTNLSWNAYNENNLVGKGDYDWSKEQSQRNGQYVFGNPYTASVDISKLDFGTNLEPTVYIYTTGSHSEWLGSNTDPVNGGATGPNYTAPGQYQSVPQNISTTDPFAGKRYLSSMQGFVVMMNSNSASNNTFKMSYNAIEANKTVSKNTVTQRSAKSQEDIYTIIDLTSENYADRLWIFVNPECTKGYNAGWDGRKFANETNLAILFTMEEDDNYQVSTMDDINDTYLGIKAGTADTEYTLTFNHTGIDRLYSKVELIDLYEDKRTDITADKSTYTFTANETDITKRFKISTEIDVTSDQETEKIDLSHIHVYSQGNTIVIENNENNSGTVSLYDTTGRCMLTSRFDANKKSIIDTNLYTGSYIIKLSTAKGDINKSLILK